MERILSDRAVRLKQGGVFGLPRSQEATPKAKAKTHIWVPKAKAKKQPGICEEIANNIFLMFFSLAKLE